MFSKNSHRRAEAQPFGIKDKIGYLLGDFGNDFTFLLSSSFLLKFYTDVMGVSAGIVGITQSHHLNKVHNQFKAQQFQTVEI